MPSLRIGTRGSALAMAQAQSVARMLEQTSPGLRVTLEVVRTTGDAIQDRPLRELGATGLFTRELDTALLDGRIDAAVHSMKDLPSRMTEGIMIACVPEREDPRDVFIGRDTPRLTELPEGAVVATGSPRRKAHLLRLRPDIQVVDLRGNIDTRLRKLLSPGGPGGIILAVAGLRRLKLEPPHVEILDLLRWLPAPGQGALAVTTRCDDKAIQPILASIDHLPSRLSVFAERVFLDTWGGGCHAALGAFAEICGNALRLHGCVSDAAGTQYAQAWMDGPPEKSEALGMALARSLHHIGANWEAGS